MNRFLRIACRFVWVIGLMLLVGNVVSIVKRIATGDEVWRAGISIIATIWLIALLMQGLKYWRKP